MKEKFSLSFAELVSVENLLKAWQEFLRGKRSRHDVQEYATSLMDNILVLHSVLVNKTYRHGNYHSFNICDPKPRNIHKASIQDRLLHHAVYRHLYPFFSKTFISDSFSYQLNKGTHRALNRFRTFAYKANKNNAITCYVLKCDIRKFFANINHAILESILRSYIIDRNILDLLSNIIRSFDAAISGVGLPLGNLTSQLFVNIYMNEFDKFVKHKLKAKYYIRYCDDFVIFSEDKNWLESILLKMQDFLLNQLKLELHPNKVYIKTVFSGMDFLGWKHFPHHRVLRTVTKRRLLKRIKNNPKPETLNSYFGLLKHGNTEKIKQQAWEVFLLSRNEK